MRSIFMALLGLLFINITADAMTPSEARVVDPILTTVVQGYHDPEFIGLNLFPSVPVIRRGGKIIKFGAESFKRYSSQRAPGGSTKRVQIGYEDGEYAVLQHRLEGKVPVEVAQEGQAAQINHATLAANGVMKILTREHEIACAEKAQASANYQASNREALAGTDQWDNDASTPGVAVSDYKETIRKKTGARANVLVLGAPVYNKLKFHPAILDRFKYTSADSVTEEMLARYFDVGQVVVGRSIYMNQAGEFVDVWGNAAILAYVPKTAGGAYMPGSGANREQPSYGYTYVLSGNPNVETPYFDNNTKSNIYPVTYEHSVVQSGFDAGFLIQSPIS